MVAFFLRVKVKSHGTLTGGRLSKGLNCTILFLSDYLIIHLLHVFSTNLTQFNRKSYKQLNIQYLLGQLARGPSGVFLTLIYMIKDCDLFRLDQIQVSISDCNVWECWPRNWHVIPRWSDLMSSSSDIDLP